MRYEFLYQDMFEVDISDVDVIFAFIGLENMEKLVRKLSKEMKSTAIVLTCNEPLFESRPREKLIVDTGTEGEQTLYLYTNSHLSCLRVSKIEVFKKFMFSKKVASI